MNSNPIVTFKMFSSRLEISFKAYKNLRSHFLGLESGFGFDSAESKYDGFGRSLRERKARKVVKREKRKQFSP